MTVRQEQQSEPPKSTGESLAAFPRRDGKGNDSELRIALDEYNGHPYLSVRIWTRDRNGNFWPSRSGVTIRRSELAGAVEALSKAAASLGESGGRERRRVDAASLPKPSQYEKGPISECEDAWPF